MIIFVTIVVIMLVALVMKRMIMMETAAHLTPPPFPPLLQRLVGFYCPSALCDARVQPLSQLVPVSYSALRVAIGSERSYRKHRLV